MVAEGLLDHCEPQLLTWFGASEWIEVPWSTKRAAEAFKVTEKDVYEALSSLTNKVPDLIQISYDDGAIRIAADSP